MKRSMVLWFHKDRNYRRKHVLSSKSQFDPIKEHAQPLCSAHFKLSTAHSFFFKYFIWYRISSRYFTNSFRRMKKSWYYDFIKIGNVEETCQINENCESMIQVHSKFYRREWHWPLLFETWFFWIKLFEWLPFLLAYVTQFSQFEHLMRLDFLRRAYTWRKKRVSMGWWLLRLTVKILVNLRLTVNTFPLFPLDIFFTVNFFYD